MAGVDEDAIAVNSQVYLVQRVMAQWLFSKFAWKERVDVACGLTMTQAVGPPASGGAERNPKKNAVPPLKLAKLLMHECRVF